MGCEGMNTNTHPALGRRLCTPCQLQKHEVHEKNDNKANYMTGACICITILFIII